jgi:hypothetical protein
MQFRTKLILWLLPPILLLSSTAALYLFSPQIAELALQRWLQQQNFSQIELNMQPPGWNELRIESARLIKQDQDKEILFEVQNLTLHFNPVEMFTLHRMNELQVQKSSVVLRYSSLPESTDNNEIIDLSQALPSHWFDKVPADSVRIGELKVSLDYPEDTPDWHFDGAFQYAEDKLTSRVHFQRDDQDLGWADLETRADDHFNLRILENDQPFLVINGELVYADALKLQSSQLIELQGFQAWFRKLIGLELNIPEVSGSLSTTGLTAFPVRTQFTPDALLSSIETDQTLDAQFKLARPADNMGPVETVLAGALKFSDNNLSILLDNKTKFAADKVKPEFATQPLSRVEIGLPEGVNISTDLSAILNGEALSPSISPMVLEFSIPEISLEKGSIAQTSSLLHLEKIDLKTRAISGRFSSQDIQISVPDLAVPALAVNSTFSLTADTLNGEYSVDSKKLPLSVTGKFKTDITTANTQLDWALAPIALQGIDRTLAPYYKLPPELSISKGTLFHKGSGTINNGKLNARAYNRIRSADASWDDYRFENLDWDSVTDLKTVGNITDKGSVKLQRAKTGVDITEIKTDYQFQLKADKQQLSLKNLTAETLQGQVAVEPVTFDPVNPEFETEVTVEQIDLGEVLSLEQQEGLTGEGKLSGSFPVAFKNGELTIEDGGLFSLDPGGKILFAPNPAVLAYAATNVGLKMALEALENFHFDTLDIKLNYSKDGTAHLNTRLKGNNPDWNNGHPVDFTINIEENIPKLLQALQFTEKLTKTIEKRYR